MTSKNQTLNDLSEITKNRYQAVLLAAKRARMINSKRLAQLQMMVEDADVSIDYRKVTSIALEELMNGKIKLKDSE